MTHREMYVSWAESELTFKVQHKWKLSLIKQAAQVSFTAAISGPASPSERPENIHRIWRWHIINGRKSPLKNLTYADNSHVKVFQYGKYKPVTERNWEHCHRTKILHIFREYERRGDVQRAGGYPTGAGFVGTVCLQLFNGITNFWRGFREEPSEWLEDNKMHHTGADSKSSACSVFQRRVWALLWKI